MATEEIYLSTFTEKVRQIIHDYIDANPGSTKERIYDEVASRMVRGGQMEAHDFDELHDKPQKRLRGKRRKWYIRRKNSLSCALSGLFLETRSLPKEK